LEIGKFEEGLFELKLKLSFPKNDDEEYAEKTYIIP
jgi:hypothetical protein